MPQLVIVKDEIAVEVSKVIDAMGAGFRLAVPASGPGSPGRLVWGYPDTLAPPKGFEKFSGYHVKAVIALFCINFCPVKLLTQVESENWYCLIQ